MLYLSTDERDSEQGVELVGPAGGDAGVHTSLSGEKLRWGVRRVHVDAVVPGPGMDVDTFSGGDVEGAHVCRFDIVSQCGGSEADGEGDGILWPEELSAVGVVVAHPEVDVVRVTGGFFLAGGLGEGSEAVEVVVAVGGDGEVVAVVEVPTPLDLEVALGGAGLVAGVRVKLPPADDGPGSDFKGFVFGEEVVGVVDDPAEAPERLVGGIEEGHVEHIEVAGEFGIGEVFGCENKAHFSDTYIFHRSFGSKLLFFWNGRVFGRKFDRRAADGLGEKYQSMADRDRAEQSIQRLEESRARASQMTLADLEATAVPTVALGLDETRGVGRLYDRLPDFLKGAVCNEVEGMVLEDQARVAVEGGSFDVSEPSAELVAEQLSIMASFE